jgi:hypothetical protein
VVFGCKKDDNVFFLSSGYHSCLPFAEIEKNCREIAVLDGLWLKKLALFTF